MLYSIRGVDFGHTLPEFENSGVAMWSHSGHGEYPTLTRCIR